MRKLAIVSAAAVIGLGSLAATPTRAEPLTAAAIIGGSIAAGALVGSAAATAYPPAYAYEPVTYVEPAPVVRSTRVVRRAPARVTRVIDDGVYASAVPTRRVIHEPVIYAEPVHRWGPSPMVVGWGGPVYFD